MPISLASFFSSLEPSVSSDLFLRDNASGADHAVSGFSQLLVGDRISEGGVLLIDNALMQQSEMSDWVLNLLALVGSGAGVDGAVATSVSGISVDLDKLRAMEGSRVDVDALLSSLPFNDSRAKSIPSTVLIESSAVQSVVQSSSPRLLNVQLFDSNLNLGGQAAGATPDKTSSPRLSNVQIFGSNIILGGQDAGGITAAKETVFSQILAAPVKQGVGAVDLGALPREVLVAARSASGQGVVLPTMEMVEKGSPVESRAFAQSTNSTTFHASFSKVEHSNAASFASKLASTLADKVHLLSATTKSDSVATLRMDPPDLGKVGVKIKVDGERLVVQVSASTNATRDALTDASEKLRSDLSQYFAEVEVAVGQSSYDFYSELDDQVPEPVVAIEKHDESRSVEQMDDGLVVDYLARV
ncbi:flagellar hook-length control protein FliK [Vibrio sp. PNB22_3_1]